MALIIIIIISSSLGVNIFELLYCSHSNYGTDNWLHFSGCGKQEACTLSANPGIIIHIQNSLLSSITFKGHFIVLSTWGRKWQPMEDLTGMWYTE